MIGGKSIKVDFNVFTLLGLDPKNKNNPSASKQAYKNSMKNCQKVLKTRNIQLAYEILCNNNLKKRIKPDGSTNFSIEEDDPSFPVVMIILQDIEALQHCQTKHGNQFFNQKDELKRSFLYLAVKYEYENLIKFLLSIGADVNDTQSNLSTSLHCASYYGLKESLKLLLLSGSNPDLQNDGKHIPFDEAQNDTIKEILTKCQNNKVITMVRELRTQFPNLRVNFVTVGEKIKSMYIFNPFSKDLDEKIDNQKNERFHGTKLSNIVSIFRNGFIIPGGKTDEGITITRPGHHIKSNIKVKGVDNFAKAVFLSQSPFYASIDSYSEKVELFGTNFKLLVHCYPYDQKWTEHTHTITGYKLRPGEDEKVESRILENEKIFVRGLYLINEQLLNSLKNFQDFWYEFEPQRSKFLDKNDGADEFNYQFCGSIIKLQSTSESQRMSFSSLSSRTE